MENFVKEGISKSRIAALFRRAAESGTELQALEVYRGDELLIRTAPAPYSCRYKGQIYSLSKSFTSTAIGMLADDGKLSVEDRIIDIFPDKCPDILTENLAEMRLKHLLSMNTGHEVCVMPELDPAEDGVKTFLSLPVPHKPGTHFAYNTAASYMLSAVVTRVSGLSLLDFLNIRLFAPLGITGVRWRKYAGDVCEGGVGVFLSCDDIAKLGLLYLHKGMWQGNRLLSEKWVEEASAFHSDNSGNGTPDWTSGYGFQFWRNARGGYRGDGAFGQFCAILPERNLVIAAKAETTDMQKELDLIFDFAENMEESPTPADLPDTLERLYLPLRTETPFAMEKWYRCEAEKVHMTLLHLYAEENELVMQFSNGEFLQEIRCGNGRWVENRMFAKEMFPTLIGLIHTKRLEELHFAASFTAEPDGLRIQWRYLDSPHRMNLTLKFTEGGAVLDFDQKGLLNEPARQWHLPGLEPEQGRGGLQPRE